ncbi:retrovirus-related Pol polyprotein from transposon opus [Trichonephila inaurata madagascariensis]|uniref:Retrovirus-related Pol polyprotein from transposon opus n=1 Tax=Trichonephila inaurata madagascariensis TaxID=2747483 RepID=A0A8X7CJZ6_9ARAC|nr:retrovirus-related Pol polyprotein from transposon opus [Trichonephila inaurata madagascariensis]
MRRSQKFYREFGFPGVYGALDCSLIKILNPGGSLAETFRCRKGFFALNVQTVSDPNLCIRNIVVRWPGSTHDSTVFDHSYLRAHLETEVPSSYHLLGDSGYHLRSYLMTPFLNPVGAGQVRYNAAHARARNVGLTSTPEAKVSIYELTKVVPKFEMKDGDIVLFLTLFERQAKRVNIEKRHWVSALLALMPSEINQLMAREAEEKFDDYDYIKGILLKRFKLSAEIFRRKFVKHQWNPNQSWRDFVFEITSYFEEWLGGLGVNDFEGLKNLMITDQLKRRVPGDVREQFVDNWVKSIVPGDLADKLDEYESVRANVKGAHSNDTRVSVPVSVPINTRNGIDDLQLVDIICGQTSIKAVIDTGAQVSVLREDLIGKGCGEGEGTIQIISAFGEKEIANLKLFNLKIDDGKHESVQIMFSVSKKLRDFEGTKDKDIEFRKETENETRIREARHKEEEQARLKAEVEARLEAEEETKAVEERLMMEEERRMNERIALEEEMRLKKERWLVEEQIRPVQKEHKMRMTEKQKCLPEERCEKADEEVLVFKSERAQIFNVDPDVVAQPVSVEEEKGLSRNSSNVPPISAEDETYEKSTTQDQERKVIAERDDGKFEGTEVPVVHSVMVFKMCEGLGLQAQLAAESDRKIWIAKKKPRPIPIEFKDYIKEIERLNRVPTVPAPASQPKRKKAKRQSVSPRKDTPSKKQACSEQPLPNNTSSPARIGDAESSMEEGETTADESSEENGVAKTQDRSRRQAARRPPVALSFHKGRRIAPIVIDSQRNATELLDQLGKFRDTPLEGDMRMESSESFQFLPKSTDSSKSISRTITCCPTHLRWPTINNLKL